MKIALLGTGTVGRSVAELSGEFGHTIVGLADSQGAVCDDGGIDVEAALERARTSGSVGDSAPEAVLEADYDVLVEATPTTLGDAEPAFTNVEAALERDRDVVLANQGPVAERFEELREAQRNSEGTVKYGATVGGSLPVVELIHNYGPSNVLAVRGVLNDTANFILSRMGAEKLDYDHVLTEAKELGIAEEDPQFDVDGTDTAIKCAIVANVLASHGGGAFEDVVSVDDVEYDGIRALPGSLLELAAQDGRTIRLIGEVTEKGVRAGPRLVTDDSPLSASGAQNVVQIDTVHSGTVTLSGAGSGGSAVASAIFSDIAEL